MRYVEFAAESQRSNAIAERLREIERREWALGDIAVCFSVIYRGEAGAEVSWQVGRFQHMQGTTFQTQDRRTPRDGCYQWNSYPGNLTASQLHRVAQCLEVAEAWIAGKVDSMPDRAPDNIEFVEPKRPDGYTI